MYQFMHFSKYTGECTKIWTNAYPSNAITAFHEDINFKISF